MSSPSTVLRSVARVAVTGLLVVATVGVSGAFWLRASLGPTDAAAIDRVRQELDARFATAAGALGERARRVGRATSLIAQAKLDPMASRDLFRLLDAEVAEGGGASAGLSIFDGTGVPLAWTGRVSDLPKERIDGPAALFAIPSEGGPRLVRVEPITDPERAAGPRLATVVAEQMVSPRSGGPVALDDAFFLPTSVIDVAVRPRSDPVAPPGDTLQFAVRGPDGQPLLEADIAPGAIAATRARRGAEVRGAVLGTLALVLLACGMPVLEARRRARSRPAVAVASGVLALTWLGARGLVWLACAPFIGWSWAAPWALLPNALVLLGLGWMAIDLIERHRVGRPRRRLWPAGPATALLCCAGHVVAGAVAALMLFGYERALHRITDESALDVLQFSLHPLEPVRLGVAFGLVVAHAAVIWLAAAVLRLPAALWRTPRHGYLKVLAAPAVVVGLVATATLWPNLSATVPLGPWLAAFGAAGLAAALMARPRGGIIRRASQSARLAGLFLALLLPAVAVYPSLVAFTTAAKERLVSTNYAPQAARQRQDLQARLPRVLEAIDAFPGLADLVTTSSEDAAPTTDRAFLVWSATELAASRTTSAVELYGRGGGLVSWFALTLPEYGSTPFRAGRCDAWDPPYEEASMPGTGRGVLRTSRAICSGGQRVGGIVVRAMLDYQSLPFISSANPYFESLRRRTAPSESAFGRDVEFAAYGWSRATLYASGTSVWPLEEPVFSRMVASREPFWTTVTREGSRFRVYFFSDRNGIYALGYPVLTGLGHLINLGELVFLAAVLYAGLLAVATMVAAFTAPGRSSGRALLRELRSSFYRKLFMAFAGASGVPIVVLAVLTQRYFANQYRAGVEEAAAQTATVAQRLVEDYATLQQRGANSLQAIDDQVMVLVRRAIDQDVNLFDGDRLQATSERPLFASRLLPSRTPGRIYRSIVLERLPTAVDVEDVGGLPYLLAAAPVRAGGREGIVTVPQPLRSRESEAQSDELDRRVLSASVLFVLVGAAVGYWMAERIADPVNRLTRATRRIARGDLDARVAATSSDELGRLVDDFNRMADDLTRQRAELERTQRLEAWADMARQVAHDIKNPLTPIQLSAEHAQRVNQDRGRPLSPALDECVASILSQVRLLRQISAEFSSFASSPTPRPEPTAIAALIEEVIDAYRVGVAGRVALTLDVEPGLPDVLVDRTLFARALTNVIENALHAMPGGGSLAVACRSVEAASGRRVRTEVRDTGVGMDQEDLKRIFEPYFSTRATGTGLGLTIAKRNIELVGGTIAVTSARGVGTTVAMELPSAGAAMPADRRSA